MAQGLSFTDLVVPFIVCLQTYTRGGGENASADNLPVVKSSSKYASNSQFDSLHVNRRLARSLQVAAMAATAR